MNVFRYRLRPATPWGTPWLASHMFAALCDHLARRQGEADVEKLMARFRKDDPPFLISNAFPGDLLPRPAVTPGDQPWISRQEFSLLREKGVVDVPHPQAEPFHELHTLHGSRRDPTQPFETREWTWSSAWAKENPSYFSLYARLTPEWVAPLGKLLQGVGITGFGKRRTTGRGQFDVEGPAEACPWLDPLPFESGFVTLSHFLPQETDPARGRWTVHLKNTPAGRLVHLGAGSCFQCPGRPKRWYGRMVPESGRSQDVAGLHYGLALAVGIHWPAGV